MINEEQSYSRLKNNIPAKNIQGDDIEKDRLIEHSKGINKILNQNERQNLKLKTEV